MHYGATLGSFRPLRENLTTRENELFKSFIDEMFVQLAKPYTTSTKDTVYIRADTATVQNIASCYARAERLDLSLARQTKGYFIEPEYLLTITVPMGLTPKEPFKGEASGTFASCHRTSWETFWWKTASAQPFGARMNKTFTTSFLATVSSATPPRSVIPMIWDTGQSSCAHQTSTRLARASFLRD